MLDRATGPSATEFAAARLRILGGAADVFAKRGVNEPAIEDILVASQVSRRTFYRFFKNREEVLHALYEVTTGTFMQRVRDAVSAADDPWGKLRACVRAYLEFHGESGPLLRVLQAEAMRPDSLLHPRHEATLDEIAEIFDREIRESQGRVVDPLVIRGLLFALEGVSNVLLAEAHGAPIDLKRGERIMLRIVGASLTPDGGPTPPMPLGQTHGGELRKRKSAER